MDKLDFALEVMVVGFSVVLATLFLLYGILIAFSRIFNKKEIKNPKTDAAPKSPVQFVGGEDNAALTAVITAAIYSYLENNAPSFNAAGFRITALPGSDCAVNNWQISGRRQLMEGKAELETTRRNKRREKI
jgi:Na+-transporting methylmalonyl-CoA/oxaloacetate decarboxylase gamma subunit